MAEHIDRMIPPHIREQIRGLPEVQDFVAKLAGQAYLDPTGAYSDIVLNDYLARSVGRMNRAVSPRRREMYAATNGPLGIVIVDMGNLHGINENYGRQVGDDALAYTADTCKQSATRPEDMVARWGRTAADEFVLILPRTDEEGCLTVYRDHIQPRLEAYSGLPDGLSSSAGIRIYNPSHEIPIHDPVQLLYQADSALEVAKSARKTRALRSSVGVFRQDSGIFIA